MSAFWVAVCYGAAVACFAKAALRPAHRGPWFWLAAGLTARTLPALWMAVRVA